VGEAREELLGVELEALREVENPVEERKVGGPEPPREHAASDKRAPVWTDGI